MGTVLVKASCRVPEGCEIRDCSQACHHRAEGRVKDKLLTGKDFPLRVASTTMHPPLSAASLAVCRFKRAQLKPQLP